MIARAPAEAVILAIDPGSDNGSAIFLRGVLVKASGSICTREGRETMIRRCVQLSQERGVPFVCVMETWTQHRKRAPGGGVSGVWTFKSALSCGEQAGRWLADVEHANPHGVVRVEPLVWRRGLWGGRPMTTEIAKAAAIRHADLVFNVMADHNEAEAICIGHWATHADAVHAIVRAHQG